MSRNVVDIYLTHDAILIAAGGVSYSRDALNVSNMVDMKSVSAQYTVSGSGTCKLDYVCSNDGINYYLPTDTDAVQAGIVAGSGFEEFTIPTCQWMKLRFTETGGANSVTVTNRLAI